jgi:hypothetical protein
MLEYEAKFLTVPDDTVAESAARMGFRSPPATAGMHFSRSRSRIANVTPEFWRAVHSGCWITAIRPPIIVGESQVID